jgi:hypothetical protein
LLSASYPVSVNPTNRSNKEGIWRTKVKTIRVVENRAVRRALDDRVAALKVAVVKVKRAVTRAVAKKAISQATAKSANTISVR